MSDDGFVRVYRKVLDNPEFRDQSEAMIFVWMVMRASWKPSRVRYKERSIQLDRGQLAISVRDLAAVFGRSKDWANRFLERLTNRDMIATATATGVNIITLCKYEEYQSSKTLSATVADHQPRQDRDRTATQNKEENEIKEGRDNSNELSSARALPRRPDEVGDQIWRDYKKQRKKALTETALSGIRREAAKAGISLNEALTECCERGWQGFKAEWHLKETNDGNGRRNGHGNGMGIDRQSGSRTLDAAALFIADVSGGRA